MATFGAVIISLLVWFVLSLIFAVPVVYLWGGVMPEVFGLPNISYWQAWCLLILAGFLTKK